MDKQTLLRLEMLNQIKLTDAQKEGVFSFFAKREADLAAFEEIDTSEIEPMVHVIPTEIELREDEIQQAFSRSALQARAPVTDRGYWCVPRVIE